MNIDRTFGTAVAARMTASALLLALCAACGDTTRQVPDPGEPQVGEPDDKSGEDTTPPTPDGPPGIDPGPDSPDPNQPGPNPDNPDAPDGVWMPGPPLRNALTLPDAELAQQALTLLGSSAVGASGSCRNCHSLGRPTLTRWSQLTQQLDRDCLAQPQLPDQASVDAMFTCLRQRSGKPTSRFSPEGFGVYAAAAQLPWFTFLFEHAAAQPGGTVSHAEFVTRVGMPRAGQPWTQAEFDVVAEWFARRLPGLFALVPEDSGETCTPGLAPELEAYVDELTSTGWRAKNAQVPLLMYGCGPGQSGSACLGSIPLASTQPFASSWANVPGTQLRLLHDNSQSLSAFWSRGSADGRYIASGLLDVDGNGFAGQVLDLQTQQVIAGDFAYDPTFFPDNSGFLMQQGGYDDGSDLGPTNGLVVNEAVALICPQSVLDSDPTEVTGATAQCTLAGSTFGLYQQTAKSIDGDDYWVAHGSYQSDNGGFSPVLRQPSAAFDTDSSTTLTSLLNTGNDFQVGNAVRLATPQMGDPMLSPSGRLLALRVKGPEFNTTVDGFDVVAAEQSGYALYAVDTAPASGQASARLRDLGRICLTGSKPTFSYDERWL
ncbi:MAG: hypothetical protein RL685_3351, partial [Pseudomonadota bacterium]